MAPIRVFDLVLQGAVLFCAFVMPFLISVKRVRLGYIFPFLSAFAWGTWRIGLFDPLLKNDVPGIGYVIAAIGYGMIGAILFRVRRRAVKGSF